MKSKQTLVAAAKTLTTEELIHIYVWDAYLLSRITSAAYHTIIDRMEESLETNGFSEADLDRAIELQARLLKEVQRINAEEEKAVKEELANYHKN